jgi:hypothetical protein
MSIISSYEPLESHSSLHLLQATHHIVGTPQTSEEPDPSPIHVMTEGIQNGDVNMVGF